MLRAPIRVVALAAACFFFPSTAQADCVQVGSDVNCSAADVDGFDAGVDDDLDVTVQAGATVDGGANATAINLNDGSSVTNDGDITLSTNDGVTVSMGDDATIVNNDEITASGTDGRAIEVGNDATITNSATGVITGGGDGANDTGFAVRFIGTDAAAENTLTSAGGTITGGADGAIEGSAGEETILLQAGSTTTGDINTNGGDDLVRLIGAGSTLTGDVDLGEGDDRMDLNGMISAYGGNVDGGNGDNIFVVTGAGAEFTGDYTGGDGADDVFLFNGVDVDVDNLFDLGAGDDTVDIESDGTSSLDFDVDAGAGNDTLLFNAGATNANVDADLGDDDDALQVRDGSDVSGSFDLGGGSDTVEIDGDFNVSEMSGATLTGNVDLGQADDIAGDINTVTLGINATLAGDLLGGAGDDSVSLVENSDITGTVDLGAGDDTFDSLEGVDSSATTIEMGAGSDTLDIHFDSASSPAVTGGTFTGNIDLGLADDVDTDDNALNLGNDATLVGNIVGGDGNDTVLARPGATITGNIDLGTSGTDLAGNGRDDDDKNFLDLRNGSTLDGSYTGGAEFDRIFLFTNATITGAVATDDGDDELLAGTGSTVSGAVDLGDGDDLLQAGDGATFQSDVDLGAGDDTVELFVDATIDANLDTGSGDDTFRILDDSTVTGNVNLGDDSDIAVVSSTATITGSLDMGAGDDVFQLRPTTDVPTNVIPGAGSDALQLDQEDAGGVAGQADLFAIQDALGANAFERLIIGAETPVGSPTTWQLSTTGRAVFPDGATFRNGAALFDGEVQLGGDFVQEPNTQMVFQLVGDSSDPDNGRLDIDGALTIQPSDFGDPGLTTDDLIAGALVEFGDDFVIEEDTHTLISTTGGINRLWTDEEIVIDDIAVFEFDFALVGNDLQLSIVRSGFSQFGRNDNEVEVAEYLDRGQALGGSADFAAFITEVERASAAQLEEALSQFGAEAYDAHTSSVLSWGRVQQRVLHDRPMHCERFTYAPRPEIVSANPCGARGVMPWAQVVGDYADHDGGDDRGYETFGGGILLGIDHRVSDRYWWSGDIGFGHIQIENDNEAEGSFHTIDLGAAAGAVFGPIHTRGSLTYSHGFHEIDRRVDLVGETFEAKFDSDRVTLAAEVLYRARLGPLVFEPGALVDFSHVNEEAVDEDGESVSALDVDARKSDVFSVAGGLAVRAAILKYRYVGDWLEWADGVWTPMASARWRQSFGDVDRDLTSEMQGAPSAAGDIDTEARDSNGGVEVRTGVTFQPLKQGATVGIHYDGYFGDDVTHHSANASVRIPF